MSTNGLYSFSVSFNPTYSISLKKNICVVNQSNPLTSTKIKERYFDSAVFCKSRLLNAIQKREPQITRKIFAGGSNCFSELLFNWKVTNMTYPSFPHVAL